MKKNNGTKYRIMAWGIACAFPVFFSYMVIANWHSFKGTFLSDLKNFAWVEGKIIGSSGYTTNWKKKTQFHYKIIYEYSINGVIYRSDKVTFASNSRSSSEYAQEYIDKYPIGKNVTVFYDPNNPSFSVLEPNVTSRISFLGSFLFVGVFSLLGVLYLVGEKYLRK